MGYPTCYQNLGFGKRVVGKGSGKEREVGKFEVGKSEIGKNRAKFERTDRSWKVSLKCFPTSVVLSNFSPSFPTSARTCQLRSVLSNCARLFQTSAKLSNLKFSNFPFFQTALSNYTYPPWYSLPRISEKQGEKNLISKFKRTSFLILFRKLLYEWCAIIELPSFNLVIAIASFGDGIVTFARLGWFRMTMINLIMRKNKLPIHLSMKI